MSAKLQPPLYYDSYYPLLYFKKTFRLRPLEPTMTVAHTAEGGAPEGTQHPTSTQEDTNTQNQPPTTSATATATAPSNPPIYSAAQPASMSSLPEATASVQGSDPAVDTPTETTNPTPASTSSPPPPQPGAVPEPLPAGGLDTQGQGQSIVPPPPKVGEPIPHQQHGIAQMGGTGPVATTSTSTASATPYGYGGYGYGYGYNPNAATPAQQQYQYQQQYQNQYANQIPNSTTTPFGSVYPPPQPMASTLPMHYQTDNNRDYDRNIMTDDGEEKGFLDMAKGWMQTAGDKLVQVEAEVWRRINDAHDK